MLVLTRRPAFSGRRLRLKGEALLEALMAPGSGVHVGDDIRVYVLQVNDGVVRLGFVAPRAVNIRRDELPVEE